MLLSALRAQAAEALAQILPEGLCYTHFAVTGSEAVECACKLARGVTGRKKIIANGIIVGTAPFNPAVLQVFPPLIISPDEVDKVLTGLDTA